MRSRFARTARAHPEWRKSPSDDVASRSPKARVRRKVLGLFVFYAPLAESAYAHASEACLSGFESRVGYQHFEIGDSHQFHCSFTTWMWQRRPRRAATDLRRSPTRRAAGWRGSRRLMVRTAALQAAYAGSSPAGNASTHLAVARHGKRTWFGTTKPQVRILPARPTDSPVAQWIKERAVTTREVEGSNPSRGASTWRRISEERVPACRVGVRGFKSRRRRQRFAARLLARRTHCFGA